MNYFCTKNTAKEIKETLADDIYDSWVLVAQDTSGFTESGTIDLRQLADQAAFTAIGFAAALLNEEILKLRNK